MDVALRCSSIAESSSNIESVISVHVGGSGASDVVTFVELLGGRRPAGHFWVLDASRTQQMTTRACSSSSACSRTTCCSSCSSDHSSPPSPRPPARQPDAQISHTGTPAHARPTHAQPRLHTLRPLPGAGTTRCRGFEGARMTTAAAAAAAAEAASGAGLGVGVGTTPARRGRRDSGLRPLQRIAPVSHPRAEG